jgi:hypothetical protein
MSRLCSLAFHRDAKHRPATLPQQRVVHFTGLTVFLKTNYFQTRIANYTYTNSEFKSNSKRKKKIHDFTLKPWKKCQLPSTVEIVLKKKGTLRMYTGIFLSEFYVTLALLEPGSLFFWSLRSQAHNRFYKSSFWNQVVHKLMVWPHLVCGPLFAPAQFGAAILKRAYPLPSWLVNYTRSQK